MEVLFVAFLLSGQIKSFLNFFGIELPVDLTLISAVLVLCILVYKLYMGEKLITREISFWGIGLLLLFYAWLIFSLFYTSSDQYSRDKAFYFVLNVLAFSIPFLIRGFDIQKFVRFFTWGVLLLTISFLPFLFLMGKVYLSSEFGEYSAISGLYLSLSSYLGLLLILYLTSEEAIFKSKSRDRFLIITILVLMLLLGARGPLLFALMVFAIYYVSRIKSIRLAIGNKTMKALVLGSLFLVVAVVLMAQFDATQTLLTRTFGRFYSLIVAVFSGGSADASSSVTVRIELYKNAIDGIFAGFPQSIFGYGVGSFGIETFGEDMRLYPHNMILEIWFELGLIGLLIFAGWLVYLLSKTLRLEYRYISSWLLVYVFLNLMKSSSLVDIRTEFALIGMFVSQHFTLRT